MNAPGLIIKGRTRDLGGFIVQRILPVAHKRSVGPFVFLDHMGPMSVDENHGMEVRPHPHIGLATVTYLFEGRGFHRDSLGSEQIIRPGDINLMVAGRGVVHSEHTPAEDRTSGSHTKMHGVQIWLGLPKKDEECEPSFVHWPKESFPAVTGLKGFEGKLLLGEFQGLKSPVISRWRTIFLDFASRANSAGDFAFGEQEVGILVISGECNIDGHQLSANDLIVVGDPSKVSIESATNARFLVIGGTPFPEERFMWWNFVSTSKERIRKAADDWKNNRMGQVKGETDVIPLPDTPLP